MPEAVTSYATSNALWTRLGRGSSHGKGSRGQAVQQRTVIMEPVTLIQGQLWQAFENIWIQILTCSSRISREDGLSSINSGTSRDEYLKYPD
jgi:hypothetical protein